MKLEVDVSAARTHLAGRGAGAQPGAGSEVATTARSWPFAGPISKLAGGRQLLAGDVVVLLVFLACWPDSRGTLSMGWLLTVLAYCSGGLYRPRLHLSLLDQLPSLLSRSLLAMTSAAAIPALLGYPTEQRQLLYGAGLLIIGQLAARGLIFTAIRIARGAGTVAHPTLLIGNGTNARKVADILGRYRTYGLRVVGYVADQPGAGKAGGGWRYLGGIDKAAAIVRRENVEIVIFDETSCAIAGLLNHAPCRCEVTTFVMPQNWKVGVPRATDDHIGAVPILRMNTQGPTLAQRTGKRAFDLVLAVVSLIVLAPLMAVTALVIYCTDGAAPIFTQVRVGRDGKHFTMYKFRSMKPAAVRQSDVAWSPESIGRIGRIGRIIRRTSIDELPQLVNILRGDMTFVGPRPERPHYVDKFSAMFPDYRSRHRVTVGLTGLAQVSGLRGDTSIDDRVRHDNYYIDHWNLWFDIKVLIWTLGQAFGARGS